MTNRIHFTKMHGAGNDYIYVNTTLTPLEHPERQAIAWSTPHTGIGSDGLVLIGHSEKADFSMRIFNADGSEAAMCGNASRCIGKYVYEKGLTSQQSITLDTQSGIRHLQLQVAKTEEELPRVTEVTVGMGIPSIGEAVLEVMVAGKACRGTIVSMGNLHLVVFVDDVMQVDLPAVGPVLEHHPLFPDRINVEFVQVLSPSKVRMRVWERGSGITLACGTGACATVVAGIKSGKTARTTEVVMDGGTLTVHWDEHTQEVCMTGGAVTVYEGEIEL